MFNKIKLKFFILIKDNFWRNVTHLFSGTALGQALPILIFPLLTRIYDKPIFDTYFIYSAIIILTQIISNLQYHFALVLPKKDSDARTLLWLNIFITILVSLLLYTILLICSPFLTQLVENVQLISWLYLVPISTLLLGLFETFMFYLNRLGKFKSISYGKIAKGFVLVVGQLLFGFYGYSENGLLYGLILAQLFSSLLLLWYIVKYDVQFYKFNSKKLKQLAIKYKDMPKFNTLNNFISNLSGQLPVFLLSRFFGAGVSGDFGLANKVVNTPLGLISYSVGQVFYNEISSIIHSKRNMKKFVLKMYQNMFFISVVPFVILLFIAPWLFSLVFSENFATAGVMTQILVPFFALNFLNNPITQLLTALNRQRFAAIYQIVVFVFRFGALYIGYSVFNNVFISVGLYSLVGVFANIYLYFYMIKLSEYANKEVYI